jgi:hypothetical protein
MSVHLSDLCDMAADRFAPIGEEYVSITVDADNDDVEVSIWRDGQPTYCERFIPISELQAVNRLHGPARVVALLLAAAHDLQAEEASDTATA